MELLEPIELGQRIRRIREAKGLSQEQLASRISRDQRAVSLYETGQRRIFAHDIPGIAAALEVPIDYLYFEGSENEELDEELLIEFHQLDTKTRRIAIQMMRFFSKAFNVNASE